MNRIVWQGESSAWTLRVVRLEDADPGPQAFVVESLETDGMGAKGWVRTDDEASRRVGLGRALAALHDEREKLAPKPEAPHISDGLLRGVETQIADIAERVRIAECKIHEHATAIADSSLDHQEQLTSHRSRLGQLEVSEKRLREDTQENARRLDRHAAAIDEQRKAIDEHRDWHGTRLFALEERMPKKPASKRAKVKR